MRRIRRGWVMKENTRITPRQRGQTRRIDLVDPSDELGPSARRAAGAGDGGNGSPPGPGARGCALAAWRAFALPRARWSTRRRNQKSTLVISPPFPTSQPVS